MDGIHHLATHHFGTVLVAAAVCLLGSGLTSLLALRVIRSAPFKNGAYILLIGLMAGTTVWSTHFIAMLAYNPDLPHWFEPFMTVMSLVIAVSGMFCMAFALVRFNGLRRIWAGPVFGLTVSLMHYTGMAAYRVPGDVEWSIPMMLVSVVLGVVFATAAVHRLIFPVTRHCWVGATALFVTAICTMHFSGMMAVSITVVQGAAVPSSGLSDAAVKLTVVGVTFVIYLIGFATLLLESSMRENAIEQLRHAAKHDHLTGLPNRMRLGEIMAAWQDDLQQNETLKVAALAIDLDLFKQVNDMHGHAAGDFVLTKIAGRLQKACRDTDFLSRVGGDEFVVLTRGFQRIEEVVAFAKRLHAHILEPINGADFDATLGASIGIANTHEDGNNLEELIQKADMAMYRAKEAPDAKVANYTAAMDDQSRRKLGMIADMRSALAKDQFHLVYQLQNDASTLRPIGCEVLLRWAHPTLGPIPPSDFIPLAEETGMIREIGQWVLRTACSEATRWTHDLPIAVNVAPQQLAQPSFVEKLSDILFETGLPPNRLELEITETSIIDDQAHALQTMHRIKKMGVRIAMDDFGTGYSSMATLRAFPFDKIKIDRSFVSGVQHDAQSAAVLRSTKLLGDAMGIPVLAEGVEHAEELAFLQAEKCDTVQGFYFGKPMSPDDLKRALAAFDLDAAS